MIEAVSGEETFTLAGKLKVWWYIPVPVEDVVFMEDIWIDWG